MPRAQHSPTNEQRQLVQLHATIGTQQSVIADIIGVDDKTLRKHYREELDQSRAKANATIGGVLFNKAKGGDTAAMIFWMKTQAGWREKSEIDHTSSDGSMTPKGLDLSGLSDDALREVAALANPDT
jgi:hypothetical protein